MKGKDLLIVLLFVALIASGFQMVRLHREAERAKRDVSIAKAQAKFLRQQIDVLGEMQMEAIDKYRAVDRNVKIRN
jgi:hypothetical protein